MEQDVLRFIKKHQLLKRNTTVLIGVSGGPDSMALLSFLLNLRKEWNLKLIVLAVDHQLRGEESVRDSDYVEAMCQKWNVTCDRVALDVNAHKKKHHLSTQVAAREKRYQFFEEKMKAYQADYLALGHHGDDQVETMMMRFVRSATSNALSGIPVKRPFATGFIVRPFLCLTKSAIIEYCEAHEIKTRIDPSNDDPTYTRNFYRKYLIPIIKEKNNNIHTTMQQLSESLDADELFLRNEALKMTQEIVDYQPEAKEATFEINVFKSYPVSLQRRCYHLILEYLYHNLPESITYVHEDIFFNLLEEDQGNIQVDFPQDLTIEKSYHHVLFSFKKPLHTKVEFNEVIHVPGEVRLPNGAIIKASQTDLVNDKGKYSLVCDVNKSSLPLHIRTRQPGDRMNWKGLRGSKKLKDLFIDLKIPLQDRDTWPIITDDNGRILWLVGLRKSTPDINGEDSIRIQLEYKKT